MSSRRFMAVLLPLAITACADQPSAPALTAPAPGGPLLAKGTTATNDHIVSYFWTTGAEYVVRTDGRFAITLDGVSYSGYRHAVCGVKANIQLDNGGGDSFFHPAYSWTRADRASCDAAAAPRRVTLVYQDDPTTTDVDEGTWGSESLSYLYVRRLYYVGSNDWGTATPYDPAAPIIANWINTLDIVAGGVCGQLWFNPMRYSGSSTVLVTQTTVDGLPGWRVESDPAQGHRAWCVNKGRTVAAPLALLVQDLGRAP